MVLSLHRPSQQSTYTQTQKARFVSSGLWMCAAKPSKITIVKKRKSAPKTPSSSSSSPVAVGVRPKRKRLSKKAVSLTAATAAPAAAAAASIAPISDLSLVFGESDDERDEESPLKKMPREDEGVCGGGDDNNSSKSKSKDSTPSHAIAIRRGIATIRKQIRNRKLRPKRFFRHLPLDEIKSRKATELNRRSPTTAAAATAASASAAVASVSNAQPQFLLE